MPKEYRPTVRTRVRRLAQRAVYDAAQIHAILDEAFVCHVGFVVHGQPCVIPTGYARSGDRLYLHASVASRLVPVQGDGLEVCVTVTLVDGFVLARSAFHHSMNYRSVVVVGRAHSVTDPAEKRAALRCFTNHIVPGRWEEVREPSDHELRVTAVLAVSLDEASAKVRTGPPVDDEADYALPVWAGVVPVYPRVGAPVSDGRVMPGVRAFDTSRLTRHARVD